MEPISTGLAGLDMMLGGGLQRGSIVEIFGLPGVGKTNMCLHLTSKVVTQEGSQATVIYYDTKADFSAKRLLEMCGGRQEFADKVVLKRAQYLDEFIASLTDLKYTWLEKKDSSVTNCRLLVLDSVAQVFYPEMASEFMDPSWRYRQEVVFNLLKWMASNMGITIISVNHSVWKEEGQNQWVPALGTLWDSKIQNRIQLTKPQNGDVDVAVNPITYRATTFKGCNWTGSFRFQIQTNGLVQVLFQ